MNRALAVVSGGGLIAAITWHLVVLIGRELPRSVWLVLFVGVFVVWVPAVIALVPLRSKIQELGGLKGTMAMFAGAPLWMSYGALLALGYAVINFILGAGMVGGSVSDDHPAFQRVASGHSIAFYAAAMAILHAAAGRADPPRCLNGHRLAAGESRCRECGAALISS